jgi:hypothetical protein
MQQENATNATNKCLFLHDIERNVNIYAAVRHGIDFRRD